MILICFLSACSSPYHSEYESNITHNVQHLNITNHQLLKLEDILIFFDIKSKILNQYIHWKGVKFRLGGTNKNGIDCSAFVQNTFLEQFSLYLPRSTKYQKTIGIKVQRTNLLPGDLVFFYNHSTGRHIGIYISDDIFVHASSSNGVMISNLNNQYWNTSYREGRRILTIFSLHSLLNQLR